MTIKDPYLKGYADYWAGRPAASRGKAYRQGWDEGESDKRDMKQRAMIWTRARRPARYRFRGEREGHSRRKVT